MFDDKMEHLMDRMPGFPGFDDPGFDAYLLEVTELWSDAYQVGLLDGDCAGGADSDSSSGVEAAMAAMADNDGLSAHDRVNALQANGRAASYFQARMYEDMAAVFDASESDDGDVDTALAWESASSEIRAALRLTRRAADTELDFALALRDRLPQVLLALKRGSIDRRRAGVFIHNTSHLSVGLARSVVDELIDEAANLTTGQLGARIRRLCIEIDTADAKRRYEEALAERRLVMVPNDSGTASLTLSDLAPDRAAAAFAHIERIARSLRGPDEKRTIDQLRSRRRC